MAMKVRRTRLSVVWLIAVVLVIAVILFGLGMVVRKEFTVDTSSTVIEISQSRLFSRETLLDGAKHIENDASDFRGCSIDRIVYHEPHPMVAGRDGRDKPGTQTTFMMYYHCGHEQKSIPQNGSYEYRLMYQPSDSTDGTGWLTVDHGNG
ncbi:hypothetical protein [Bifidobacterium saguinibicoloris]|uniref:hypothetical protein n=1 Tax=Bifidobacterium saguinibicoloris TaxID=2834433 RepID=UPI001C5A3EDC|nr:hypothetical protein [Bifidobacterium saguinibicoloris]MBW3081402.1 hypothetical protein [Bifidobacterium saguinibicoloris]